MEQHDAKLKEITLSPTAIFSILTLLAANLGLSGIVSLTTPPRPISIEANPQSAGAQTANPSSQARCYPPATHDQTVRLRISTRNEVIVEAPTDIPDSDTPDPADYKYLYQNVNRPFMYDNNDIHAVRDDFARSRYELRFVAPPCIYPYTAGPMFRTQVLQVTNVLRSELNDPTVTAMERAAWQNAFLTLGSISGYGSSLKAIPLALENLLRHVTPVTYAQSDPSVLLNGCMCYGASRQVITDAGWPVAAETLTEIFGHSAKNAGAAVGAAAATATGAGQAVVTAAAGTGAAAGVGLGAAIAGGLYLVEKICPAEVNTQRFTTMAACSKGGLRSDQSYYGIPRSGGVTPTQPPPAPTPPPTPTGPPKGGSQPPR